MGHSCRSTRHLAPGGLSIGAASECRHNNNHIKESQMRNAIFVALAAAVLFGCGSMNYPQTREEFRKDLVSSDSSFKFVDTYVSKRRFEDVVKALKANVEACFNQDVTTTRTQGEMMTMNQTDEWRTTIKVINGNRAEVTTQQTIKGAICSRQSAAWRVLRNRCGHRSPDSIHDEAVLLR